MPMSNPGEELKWLELSSREPVDLMTWVYSKVKKMILDGALAPGEKVRQDQLASQLGVSRTPLIKALQRLSSENLVTYHPRRGFVVRKYDAEQMSHLHRLREACEGVAAYDACERASDAQIAELRSLFEPFFRVTEWTPALTREYQLADQKFHQALVELSGNPFLIQTMDMLNFLRLSYQPGLLQPPQSTLRDHLEVIDALEARNPQRAREAIEKHLRLGRENIRNVYKGSALDNNTKRRDRT